MSQYRLAFTPFSFHHRAHQLTVAMIAVSVLYGILRPWSDRHLLFNPAAVLGGEIWQFATSLFIARNPMEVVFGGLIIYGLGSRLEESWGPKRFLRVVLGIPIISLFVALLAAFVLPVIVPYSGVACIITTLWIAFGLHASLTRMPMNFWGVPLEGTTFALIGLGLVILTGLYASFLIVIPELASAALIYLYMYRRRFAGFTDRLEDAYDSWKLERLKAKRGLRVVTRKIRRRTIERPTTNGAEHDVLAFFGLVLELLAAVLSLVLKIFLACVVVRAVSSWVSGDPENVLVRFLVSVTEPLLAPLRRYVPPIAGTVDLTPVVLGVAVFLLDYALAGALYGYAAELRGVPILGDR